MEINRKVLSLIVGFLFAIIFNEASPNYPYKW